ncbi:MAG: pyruvate kinase [Nanobdellota archaeon]
MKKTKILATVSDRKCDIEFLKSLYNEGMNGVRINTAHQEPADSKKVIENVRKVSEKLPVVIDTKGPEIRTKCEEEIYVEKGEKIAIKKSENTECEEKKYFLTNYEDYVTEVPVDSSVLVDDGDMELKVIGKKEDYLICEAQNKGKIKNKKSINTPGVDIGLPPLTEKDQRYIDFAIEEDVDFIAHSFVRNKEDVLRIQEKLDQHKSNVKIIAKIENQQGVDNIDEILDNVYGIMIARGDLAIEIPAQKIPMIQKRLVKKCIERKKLVITATQMLHSMIENPRPTRAEVNDVANAIYDGTDVIMLSGETAYGQYPLESVNTMAKVADEIEEDKLSTQNIDVVGIADEVPAFLGSTAIRATQHLPVKAILIDTLTGRTARYISAFRGKKPIFTEAYDKRVMRELALSYGVFPSYMVREDTTTVNSFIKKSLTPLLENRLVDKEDLILTVAGSFGPSHGASFVEISKAKNMVNLE